MDIFSREFSENLDERAGAVLAQKDTKEERHDLKKTDEEIFEDFKHNIEHPFMSVLLRDAEYCMRTGKAFVVHKRIAILTADEDGDGYALYYNNNDAWRQSANALIGKYIQEKYPELYMPGMRLGVKGLQLLLDAYPNRFMEVRAELRKRAEKLKEAS